MIGGKKIKINELFTLILLSACGIVLVGLQIKSWGWIIWAIGLASLFFCKKKFSKWILLIYISLAFLAVTRITTDVSYQHMLAMGTTLLLAIFVPYFISRYLYSEHFVRFKFHHGRKWYRKEMFYILFTAVISFFLLPFYLKSTGAYLNWSVEPGFSYIARLFVGTNALGIWDELFFVSIVLGILRKFINFGWANIIQSILFTSFLYELGFTGWGFIMIFIFALIQGYVFKKTESLFYVITIHLTLDLILFLALINAHYPSWMPIFIN